MQIAALFVSQPSGSHDAPLRLLEALCCWPFLSELEVILAPNPDDWMPESILSVQAPKVLRLAQLRKMKLEVYDDSFFNRLACPA